jgi:hypothetical protein
VNKELRDPMRVEDGPVVVVVVVVEPSTTSHQRTQTIKEGQSR